MVHHRKVLNANDQGLGKTVEAIHAMLPFISHEHPVLIIASLGQKWFWKDEIQLWSDISEDEIEIVNSPTLNYDEDNKKYKLVYILHWDVVHRYGGLTKVPWSVLIVDEAHKQKNRKAKRTKGIWTLSRRIDTIFLLTGTPVVNAPADLWPLLKTLNPKRYTSYWRFFHEYTVNQQNVWGAYEILNVHAKELAEEIGTQAFRREKKDHLKDLPPKTRYNIPIELSSKERKAYTDMKKFMLTKVEGEIVKSPTLMGQEQKMREFCLGVVDPVSGECLKSTKIDWIMNRIEERIASGKKTVVATMRRWPLHELLRRLEAKKIKTVTLHGDIPDHERYSLHVKPFQEDPEVMVMVMMVQVGGEGWTLTAADELIFLDRPWTPKDVVQTEDRLHRMTQVNPVSIVTLIARDTVEERVENILRVKDNIVQQINEKLVEML